MTLSSDMWRVTCDVWRAACCVWFMVCCVRRVASGLWHVACGEARVSRDVSPVLKVCFIVVRDSK